MRLFPGLDPIHVVDIGANPIDGKPPYAELLQAGAARVVGFEPNPEALQRLQEKKGPHELYLPHAIGDGERHDLYVCLSPGMTSLLQPNPQILKLFHGFPRWGTVVETREVDTLRLDDVPETEGVELLKMDIQGAELTVLCHSLQRLASTLVVQAEVEFLPMYVDQPLFSDVDQFLRAQGFVLHRFFPEVSRVIQPMMLRNDIYAGLSQLLWADAVFVRDFSRLELLTETQLQKMALIVHSCYRSYDLALHLLGEVDRRKGSALAADYLAALRGNS